MQREIVTLTDGRRLDVIQVGEPDGAPVFAFHGTPTGPLGIAGYASAASAAGVRLICAGRPGYADSSVAEAGISVAVRDSLALADRLSLPVFAALGISGGGPYAAALASGAPSQVLALGLLAAVGPGHWDDADDPERHEELRLLTLAAEGRRDEAAAGLRAAVAAEIATLASLPAGTVPDDVVAAIRDGTKNGYHGYVFDMFSWGLLPWDVDIAGITCPTFLVYGDSDRAVPPHHGAWYSEQIAHAHLTVVTGADHGATIDTNMAEMLRQLGGFVTDGIPLRR
ncbi:MAG TPA: alpha/beta hydrolase [Micromonosporaceae bacterium]|jgi:pimeloyl-ACP methyl ester carboxylesterase